MNELIAVNKQVSLNYDENPNIPPSLRSSHDDALPTLPFDLIPEILCRLPVKLLLQLRCICKSWNSLITNSKFAKKHLSLSTTRSLHEVIYNYPSKYVLKSYPLDSVFNNIITNVTQFEYSPNNFDGDYPSPTDNCFVGSCNGIVCIANDDKGLVILCNPSIRKFKELPLFQKLNSTLGTNMMFGFGYDSFTDNYKVLVVLRSVIQNSGGNLVFKTEVKVHTSSTNCWKNIQESDFGVIIHKQSGEFVSGTINWLASIDFKKNSPRFIVSFDLRKESFQKVLLPDNGGVDACNFFLLAVLKDCLCVTSIGNNWVMKDVWVMKEYGNKESWTKLFTLSPKVSFSISLVFAKAVYMSEDDQVLLKFREFPCLTIYDSRSGSLKSTNIQNIFGVYVESLISPCS